MALSFKLYVLGYTLLLHYWDNLSKPLTMFHILQLYINLIVSSENNLNQQSYLLE